MDNDWSYEGPDPEVGIFSGMWIHEACPVPDDENAYVTEDWAGGEGMNRSFVSKIKLTCVICGATTVVEEESYDPEIEDIPDWWDDLDYNEEMMAERDIYRG